MPLIQENALEKVVSQMFCSDVSVLIKWLRYLFTLCTRWHGLQFTAFSRIRRMLLQPLHNIRGCLRRLNGYMVSVVKQVAIINSHL